MEGEALTQFLTPAIEGINHRPHRLAADGALSGKPLPASGQSAPQAVPIRIDKAIAQIQAFLNKSNHQLTFECDDATGRTIIKVVDQTTGDVIRQFPSEEILKIAAIIDTRVDARGFHILDEQA